MKLKESFVTHKNNDDYIMIDASGEFSGIVHSNKTTAFIVEYLKKDVTREELINRMLEHYEVSEKDAAESVDKVINALNSIGAIYA